MRLSELDKSVYFVLQEFSWDLLRSYSRQHPQHHPPMHIVSTGFSVGAQGCGKITLVDIREVEQ